jgi:hypothetical protein
VAEHELNSVLGEGTAFRDNSGIPPGTDFRKYLWRRLYGCDVLLALIGPHWWDPRTPGGRAPVMDPADFVRREIEAALEWEIRVVPVITEGVGRLAEREFPDSLDSLPFRQYHEIRTRSANTDFRTLARELGKLTGLPAAAATPSGGVSVGRNNFGIIQTGAGSSASQQFGSQPDND